LHGKEFCQNSYQEMCKDKVKASIAYSYNVTLVQHFSSRFL
jgi:hypothetical protein